MLEKVDLKKQLTKPVYTKKMNELQERLRLLQYAAQKAEVAVVVCLEGWDTAGKGAVIKKLTERLDPRLFRVLSGSAPSPLEQRYHFLWRYQIALPNDGQMAVFDHSWYGRVLVERCDKLTPKKVWREAYQQINEFERWLTDDGQVLVKLWMHIGKKEQKKRFRAALKDPLLRWKITKEYKRHHRQYDRWVEAVEEMLAKTDSPHAPWTVIEANDLRWARARVFETLIERLEQALARRKALPAQVSRTAAAAAATQKDRAARAVRDSERARAEEKQTVEAKKVVKPATEAEPETQPETEVVHA
jgi:AMP-polyphosphate phosphotransferase